MATQALTLLNNESVLRQAELFAERLDAEAPDDLDRQVDLAYQIALTRAPRPEEAEVAKILITDQSLVALTHVLFNLNEFRYMR